MSNVFNDYVIKYWRVNGTQYFNIEFSLVNSQAWLYEQDLLGKRCANDNTLIYSNTANIHTVDLNIKCSMFEQAAFPIQ